MENEKEITAQEVPVQEQPSDSLDLQDINYFSEQVSQGKSTLNQARIDIGLKPIEGGDVRITKVESDSNN